MGDSAEGDTSGAQLLQWLAAPTTDAEVQAQEDALVLNFLRQGREPQVPSELVKMLLPIGRRAERSDWEQARMCAKRWSDLGMTMAEIRGWLTAGIDIDESGLVDDLVGEGVSPTQSAEVFEHPETGERTTIQEIARRHREDAYTSLSEALDRAGIERTRGFRPSRRRWTWTG